MILKEGVRRHIPQVPGDPPDGEVHLGQLIGGCCLLLPINGDVLAVAFVALHKLDGLNEHAPGAAAWVVDFPPVRFEHLRQ